MRKACIEAIYTLAKQDRRVLFIGSDIGAGTLDRFKKEMPERFLMEGVSEAHLIGMMTGLALSGKIPYLNTIASFLTRRCYEQLLLDAALHDAPLRLVGSGGGTVYAPLGPTHLALEDIAILRAIPHMTIVAPCDAEEAKRLMAQTLDYPGPIYVRLAKGGEPVVSSEAYPCRIGRGIVLKEGGDALLVTTGITAQIAMRASEALAAQGVSAGVLHVHTLKPFDRETFVAAVSGVQAVLTLEEHSMTGGLGSIAAEIVAETGACRQARFGRIAFPDTFITQYGSQESLMARYGITAEKAAAAILTLLARKG